MPILNGNITETVEIDSNGIHDVARYTSANVNVEPIPPIIEELSITPTTSEQNITAPSGTDGYSPITVSAVDNTIDFNIQASNIKSGISILGVSGSVVESNETTLNVTPTTSAQSLTPSSPYTGYNEVNVSAVTSSIDANIIPGNIKKDVTILGVTGTHEGGTTPTGTKNITTNGTHDVTNYASANVQVPTSGPTYYIEKKVQSGTLQQGNTTINLSGVTNLGDYVLTHAYYNNTSLTTMPDFSTITIIPGVESCHYAFYNCTGLTGKVDFSSLTKIGQYPFHSYNTCSYMFAGSNITEADLSNLIEAYDSSICYMFSSCKNLTKVNMGSLTGKNNTGDGYLYMDGVFYECTSLAEIDLSSLYMVRNLTSTFYNCSSLEEIDLSNLMNIDDYSLNQTFYGCSSLKKIDLGYSPSYINNAFCGCTELDKISFNSGPLTWGSEKAKEAFYDAGKTGAEMEIAYTQMGDENYPLEQDAFQGMFYYSHYSIINFSELENVYGYTSGTSGTCREMFTSCAAHCILFPKLYHLSGRYLFSNMCSGCTNLYAMYFPSLCEIPNANTQQMFTYAFSGCSNLKYLSFPGFTPTGLVRTAIFSNMLSSCTGVTMHFPITMESKLSSVVSSGLGGTNCTALFDLVSEFTDSDSNTYTRYGAGDIIDKWGIIDDATSGLDGQNYLNILYEAWKDTNGDIYYTRCAGADVVNSHDANKEGCGWIDSEPKVNDVIYDSTMQVISATVTSIA